MICPFAKVTSTQKTRLWQATGERIKTWTSSILRISIFYFTQMLCHTLDAELALRRLGRRRAQLIRAIIPELSARR
jgi:hypothetical protein